MLSINNEILIGNLGRDPEVRYMPCGAAVASASLATSETWKNKESGEKRECTEWHRVEFFGRLAEIVGEYLKKGSKVYVEGRIQTDKWQEKAGQDRNTANLVGRDMQKLDSRGGGASESFDKSRPYESKPPASGAPADAPANDFDDDIPF